MRHIIFTEAKRIIETEGWVQDTYSWCGKGYCLIGACAEAMRRLSLTKSLTAINAFETCEEYKVLKIAIMIKTGYAMGIVKFNDHRGRPKSDILHVLDIATREAQRL